MITKENSVKLSDLIIDQDSDFQPETMADYEDRVKSGEFDGMSNEEIRRTYLYEEIENENVEFLEKYNASIRDED